MGLVVQYLSSKHEALSSNPITAKIKIKIQKEDGGLEVFPDT
jgi:hypothetical protein